jgi:hypothetical protein
MYIPLGWRHFATPADGDGLVAEGTTGEAPEAARVPTRSVHVTMGVQLPRWGDLIEGASHFVCTMGRLHGALQRKIRLNAAVRLFA